MTDRYYHAGVANDGEGRALWSSHTRRTYGAARNEALRMQKKNTWGRAVVEYWRRERGQRPGDEGARLGADYVSALDDSPEVD